MKLDPPLFPERSGVDPRARERAEQTALAGTAETHKVRGTVAALEHWVRGGTFHRYGKCALETLIGDGLSLEDALQQVRAVPAEVNFDGTLRAGGGSGMWWSLHYQRIGLPDERGGNAGYSTVEDCAYAALSLIEQEERLVYEESIVVGVA